MKKGMTLKRHMLYSTMVNSSSLTLIATGCNSSFIHMVLESPINKADQSYYKRQPGTAELQEKMQWIIASRFKIETGEMDKYKL